MTSLSGPDRPPVDRKVRRQTLLLIVAGAVLLGLVLRELVRGNLGLVGASAGIVGGFVVGLLASRIHRFDWDEGAHHVVGRVDRIGLVLLAALILASLSLDWVLGHWATGATLTALSLSASAGTLTGRALAGVVVSRRTTVAARSCVGSVVVVGVPGALAPRP